MDKQLTTGPYTDELNGISAELSRYAAELEAVEFQIKAAIVDRDLPRLIELRAKRGAIPDILNAITKDRDELSRLRLDEINRQQREAYEAQFADLPDREIVTDPLTGGTHVIVRTKM